MTIDEHLISPFSFYVSKPFLMYFIDMEFSPRRDLHGGMESDLTQTIVRQIGLASGLVDFKISAIDETWSGLRFAKRKIPQQKG